MKTHTDMSVHLINKPIYIKHVCLSAFQRVVAYFNLEKPIPVWFHWPTAKTTKLNIVMLSCQLGFPKIYNSYC